jgi:hypothetical protein
MKSVMFTPWKGWVVLAAAFGIAPLALTSANAASLAGYDLGDAANYGVLFEGGGGNQLNINNGPGINGLAMNGDIGIGGTGTLQLSGPLTLNGNVDFAGANVVDNGPYSGGNVTVNGTISAGHANVQADLNYLNNLSVTLGAEAGANLAISIGNGANQTINASAGTLDASGNRVFNVSSLSTVNGSTITINGDGSHRVVLNINFDASFNGRIVLTGGLTSDDVLFNIIGGANLTGGHTLSINSNGDTLTGTFLDPNGAVSIVHSILNGRLFGGDSHDEQIVSGAEINSPGRSVPDTSSTLIMMGIGLLSLAIAKKQLIRFS